MKLLISIMIITCLLYSERSHSYDKKTTLNRIYTECGKYRTGECTSKIIQEELAGGKYVTTMAHISNLHRQLFKNVAEFEKLVELSDWYMFKIYFNDALDTCYTRRFQTKEESEVCPFENVLVSYNNEHKAFKRYRENLKKYLPIPLNLKEILIKDWPRYIISGGPKLFNIGFNDYVVRTCRYAFNTQQEIIDCATSELFSYYKQNGVLYDVQEREAKFVKEMQFLDPTY